MPGTFEHREKAGLAGAERVRGRRGEELPSCAGWDEDFGFSRSAMEVPGVSEDTNAVMGLRKGSLWMLWRMMGGSVSGFSGETGTTGVYVKRLQGIGLYHLVVDSKSGGQAGRLEILGQELMCGPGQTFPLPPGNLGFVLQAFH